MGATSKHFQHSELACPHCDVNGCTQELVDALEALRAEIGLPIIVISAYRCQEHNQAIKNKDGEALAAKKSQHMLGTAADIRVKGLSARDLEKAAEKIPAFLNGGLGPNDHTGGIHVDVRPKKARWAYDTNGKEIPYYA